MAGRPDYAATYIPQLIAQGFSANGALAFLREQGLGIRRQTFLRAWGQALNYRDQEGRMSQVNLSRTPLAEEITQKAVPRAEGFFYPINAFVRDRETNEVYLTSTGYRTQTPVSYQEAIRGALDALRAAQQLERNTPPGQILGAEALPVIEYVPEEAG